VIDEFRRRRETVMSALARIPGAVCPRPEGAFYVMPRLPIDDADAFAAFLVRDFSHAGATVLVAPGTGFYATPGQGRHEVRLAYVLGSPDLDAAMDLLVRGVAAYAGLTTRAT
jgi:aspartate aminotransferase